MVCMRATYLLGIASFIGLSFKSSINVITTCQQSVIDSIASTTSVAQLQRQFDRQVHVAAAASTASTTSNAANADSAPSAAAPPQKLQEQRRLEEKRAPEEPPAEQQQDSKPQQSEQQQPQQPQQQQQQQQQEQEQKVGSTQADSKSDEKGFGACLMIMDDNHFLVEWLAYHWFTLPLKHLIVMVDEKSQTSPLEIFDRWRGKIDIEVVNWTYPGVVAPVPDNLMNETGVRHYLGRQHKFYEDCVKTYKLKLNWDGWVILTDTDEYISVSRFAKLPNHKLYGGPDVPDIDVRGSVSKRLRQINDEERRNSWNVTDCFVTPRTQVCLKTKENNKPGLPAKLGLENKDLLTQWYNLADTRKNGKNVINLGSVDRDYVENLDLLNHGSAHVVTPGRNCPVQQKFQIYHYAGSYEQRTFRDAVDPRGGYSNRLGGSINPTEDQCKGQRVGDLKTWLGGFVEEVGEEEAARLLKNVGSVRNWSPYNSTAIDVRNGGKLLPKLPMLPSQIPPATSSTAQQ